MSGTAIDVTIGLVLTLLLFSILVSICTEFIATALKMRASALENSIAKLLSNPEEVSGLLQMFVGYAKAAPSEVHRPTRAHRRREGPLVAAALLAPQCDVRPSGAVAGLQSLHCQTCRR